jgi:hypothetical protein
MLESGYWMEHIVQRWTTGEPAAHLAELDSRLVDIYRMVSDELKRVKWT